ncbi:YVTN repeat-like/Quino protein amine dehydrogenase [Lentinus brumalis]|uniref:YVTN repeat-like/Quino protein amine dehydrogenase n=1 Tax=Lentinus brumalis TaxID=2498619 RepID=A0A371D0G5_9APHY|nr:YVTN repeat-like/Quino protein amine dehydrogenase [Polyporus brumalis]
MTSPWDIYAEELFPICYGHPLWIPEPNQREVEIGDVGWIQDGEFCALFNAMKPQNDPVNVDKGVPLDFKIFSPIRPYMLTGNKITQNRVYSRSIHTRGAEGEVKGGTVPISAGGGFKFQTKSESGAFVLLEPPGKSKELRSKRHIVDYMHDNHASWLEFANASDSFGLDLNEQDIIFICGTIKTTKWAVAAFQGNSFRQKEGFVTGQFGPYASVDLSICISDQILPAEHYRHGPRLPCTLPADHLLMSHPDSQSGRTHAPNQCLFVHYYKKKRRSVLWPFKKPMKAAGGPHQLPPGPDNPGVDAPVIADGIYESDSEQHEQGREVRQGYDPVNVLLDYILSQSVETEVAIASDLDLYAIFASTEFPNAADMLTALQQVKPTIEVDERGVGTISVNYSAARNENLLEGEQAHAQADAPEAIPYSDFSTSFPMSENQGCIGANIDDMTHVPGETGTTKHTPIGSQAIVHRGVVTALIFSTDGSLVASGSEDTDVFIWDVHGSAALKQLKGHEDTVSTLAFSRDNSVLASASQDGQIILWDVSDGKERSRIVLDTAVDFLIYTPDGMRLLAGASDGKLHVWSSATYNLEKTITKNTDSVTFIIFSQDGRRMATGGTESVCYIWETVQLAAENPEPLSVLTAEENQATMCAAAFSPNGNRVVTASDDGFIRLWKAETGEALLISHEHTGPVWSVAFSPDGKRVASGSSDSTVKVCGSYQDKGFPSLSLEGHEGIINAVEFSPDGQWIASAASDHTVRLWKASDGVCTTVFNEHEDNVTSVIFSPGGHILASSSFDGTVRLRPLSAYVEA